MQGDLALVKEKEMVDRQTAFLETYLCSRQLRVEQLDH